MKCQVASIEFLFSDGHIEVMTERSLDRFGLEEAFRHYDYWVRTFLDKNEWSPPWAKALRLVVLEYVWSDAEWGCNKLIRTTELGRIQAQHR